MAEWLNAAVLKTVEGSRPPGVRIPPSPQMYYAYILESIKSKRHYFGSTQNIEGRLKTHNAGKVRSTKHYRPWKIHYYETFETRSEAYKREMFFKSLEGRIWLKKQGIL